MTACFPVAAFFFALAATAGEGDNTGVVSFPNSGKPEAQAPFLRGLALLHNFEYDDAAESFLSAQGIDSGFAMAYWGEAMTKHHPIWMQQDRDAARAILERLGATRGARLAKAPTQREKDYLATLEALYFGSSTKEQRDFEYADALALLRAKYPEDPDAAAFHALSLLGTAHEGRDIPTYMRSAAILQDLVCAHPSHPGVLHYLIHSYDDPVHAPLGLSAARVYGKIAPAAAHAQHMTSHIFLALGMWDDVVGANETAVAVVDRSRAAKAQPPRRCGHYNFWLEYGYLQQGRFADARKVLESCGATAEADGPAPGCHLDLDPDNSTLGSYVQMRARYLLDTEDWKGELAKQEIQTGGQAALQITVEFIRGFGAVRRGELDAARAALTALRAARVSLEAYYADKQVTDPGYRRRGEVLERQMQAMILAREGQSDQAIEILRQAAKLEESMPAAFGPPFVDKPTGELLGEQLLALGRTAEARSAFEASLARAPVRTASLLGLARAAARDGDSTMAAETYGKLRKIWRRADRLPDEMREPAAARR